MISSQVADTHIQDTFPTRLFQTLSLSSVAGESPKCESCLVRIYPAAGIGQVVHLGTGCLVLGRDEGCSLSLIDDAVSRRHAMIENTSEGYVVCDMGSTNGTYINNERIETRRLVAGDRLRVGNQIFKFLNADRLEAQYCETVYKIMTTDGLTQAYNKRYLLDVLEREIVRGRRSGRPVSVMMIDVDHFKQVNDTWGHLAGDEVLQELCRRVQSALRADEILARYGGEEFAILLSESSLEDARLAGERLRQLIAAAPFHTEQADISVTVSIGVATSTGELAPSELLDAGDQNLYAAKHGGRNRVAG